LVHLVIFISRFLLPKSGAFWSSEISFDLVGHYISYPMIDEKGGCTNSHVNTNSDRQPQKNQIKPFLSLSFSQEHSSKPSDIFKPPNQQQQYIKISISSITTATIFLNPTTTSNKVSSHKCINCKSHIQHNRFQIGLNPSTQTLTNSSSSNNT
jgi:hypothetical protein